MSQTATINQLVELFLLHRAPFNGGFILYTEELHALSRAAYDEGLQEATDIVLDYATKRLDAIRNEGKLPVIPQPSEDIVAALRVAARRVREQ